jgi:hypothetical protein
MANLNDFIIGKGEDARKATENAPQRQKTNYIRLKDGQSVRGYLLTNSFIAFYQHGDFSRKIHSHVCSDPRNGKECLSCKNGVNRSKVWLVPFYDVDAGEVRVFEAKKKYISSIYSFTDQYEEESTTTPVVLSRSGSDAQSTTYTLMPLRVKANEKDLFKVPDAKVDDEFYMNVLQPPTEEYLEKLLGIGSDEDEVKPIEEDNGEPSLFDNLF